MLLQPVHTLSVSCLLSVFLFYLPCFRRGGRARAETAAPEVSCCSDCSDSAVCSAVQCSVQAPAVSRSRAFLVNFAGEGIRTSHRQPWRVRSSSPRRPYQPYNITSTEHRRIRNSVPAPPPSQPDPASIAVAHHAGDNLPRSPTLRGPPLTGAACRTKPTQASPPQLQQRASSSHDRPAQKPSHTAAASRRHSSGDALSLVLDIHHHSARLSPSPAAASRITQPPTWVSA